MARDCSETAYAKLNLALHIRARRADGYHDIETLFAFVDGGDTLTVAVGDQDRLTITGPFADGLAVGEDNLVLRALSAMRALVPEGAQPIPPLAITLDKALPIAAGIGGGSADAAAMIRLLDRNFVHLDDADELVAATTSLGADVGACIVSRTRLGTGLGADLQPVAEDDAAGCPVLLVNPLEAMPTGPVFAAWDGVDRGALGRGSVLSLARAGRNDLEAPARAICPVIDDVMAVLSAQLPAFARMSGSGATCFALFDSIAARDSAQARIAADQPDWWLMSGLLR